MKENVRRSGTGPLVVQGTESQLKIENMRLNREILQAATPVKSRQLNRLLPKWQLPRLYGWGKSSLVRGNRRTRFNCSPPTVTPINSENSGSGALSRLAGGVLLFRTTSSG